ncbi:ABC transporter ATP-binding protein [Candidatus Uabimicrobium sp. HlEnr_7]|uniref:ABC transporter ATP-binding protein n=1 Tax=Candidatus Uabimicrobium helgolandensis TaxID=3095367 RepID=UPI003557363C
MDKNNKPLSRFLRYSHKQKRQIYLASLFSVLNKIFDIAPPFLIGAAVDIVVKKENSMISHLGFVAQETQLVFLAVITVIVWALESITEYMEKIYWRNIAQDIQHSMRIDAWQHLQSLDMSFFEKYSSGRIMSIINDDVNQLERFLDVGANSLIQIATTVVIVGGTYFYISPSIAFFTMLPTPFILIGAFYFQTKLAPRYADIREKVTQMNERLTNCLGGITTIKSYTTEKWEVEQFRSDSASYQESNRQAIRFSSAFVPVIRVFILMGFTSVLLLGGWKAIEGTMEVGIYSILIFLTQRLLWPLTGLAQIVDLYERAMASTTRILNLLDEKSQVITSDNARKIDINHGDGKVAFDNLSFAYDEKKVLDNINICVEAGKSIGIIGPKGSGKTTLMKLLLRFYDFQTGDILIDGISIKDFDLQSLRKNIGLVSQDVFLFQGTIGENIAYGSPDVNKDSITKAAEISGISSFVSSLPQGYDTIVGERGQKLSGGQRQCISIARAIVKNPPILILDEATSAVDNETEAVIQKSLEEISRNRTMIMIAHRLSTVRNADCIFVMDNGKVAEHGTHEQLLKNGQFYSRAWKVQTGER